MSSDSRKKTTPLHSWHLNAGASMGEFSGYDMPLWYPNGTRKEHLAVLNTAGLFDTCHMASMAIRGNDALPLLQHCFTRDLNSLREGRCTYGAFLNEEGHCIDDAIIYNPGNEEFMVVVNSGMGERITSHLSEHACGMKIEIHNITSGTGKIDLQGPESARILRDTIVDSEEVLKDMVYFSFKGRPDSASAVKLKTGEPLLISRTGYTGEFGFELFLPRRAVPALWETLLEAGRDRGILPCGLAARDSLRTGAVLPLSLQDIGGWKFLNHPWTFTLPWNREKTGFSKEFIGRTALEKGFDRYTLPFAGDDPRKVDTKTATVMDMHKETIGRVLTCTTDMGITLYEGNIVSCNTPGLPESVKIRGLSCGFLLTDRALEQGAGVLLQDGQRSISATIVSEIRPDRSARKAIEKFL